MASRRAGLKAEIKSEETSKSKKLTLAVYNDSNHLRFTESDYGWDNVAYKIVRSEDAFVKALNELKKEAEKYLSKHPYPYYLEDKAQWEALKGLLHLGDKE